MASVAGFNRSSRIGLPCLGGSGDAIAVKKGMDLPTMTATRPSGFTLVELMVVLVILAALLAIGLPNFRGSVDSTRVATMSNEVMAALSLARMEAMRSTRQSIICPSANGTSCSTDWTQGWLVGNDTDSDGDLDTVVRYIQPKEGTSITVGAASSPNLLIFSPRGRPAAGTTPITFRIEPYTCPPGKQLRRTISVNASGQATLAKGNCP
jgi:type IV fimbrial biogenesis protein FimT